MRQVARNGSICGLVSEDREKTNGQWKKKRRRRRRRGGKDRIINKKKRDGEEAKNACFLVEIIFFDHDLGKYGCTYTETKKKVFFS